MSYQDKEKEEDIWIDLGVIIPGAILALIIFCLWGLFYKAPTWIWEKIK